jgi:hypothetical protein
MILAWITQTVNLLVTDYTMEYRFPALLDVSLSYNDQAATEIYSASSASSTWGEKAGAWG